MHLWKMGGMGDWRLTILEFKNEEDGCIFTCPNLFLEGPIDFGYGLEAMGPAKQRN